MVGFFMPNYDIVNFRTTDFDEDIALEFQQFGAKLEGTYREEPLIGSDATFNVLGKSEATKATTMFGDTPEPPNLLNLVRVVIPGLWHDVQWIDEHEWDMSMATTGKLPARYARLLAASLGRAKDNIVFNALVGDAINRTVDTSSNLPTFQTASFPASQIIADGGLPFSVDKLIDAYAKLQEDEAHDGRVWCCIVPRQQAQMMRDTNFTSFDFNSERPLKNGYLGRYYNIDFIVSSLLGDLPALASSTVDTALLWNQEAVGFKRQQAMQTTISIRHDKRELIQLYTRASGGFTRIQDKGVIQVKSFRAA